MTKKMMTIIILALVLCVTSYATAQDVSYDEIYSENGPFMAPMEPDPGIPDTVTAETKILASGTTDFTLEVYLYNDEELGGFNLPITWNSPDITCDSVSFVGSRGEYVNTKLFSIDNDNQRLQAGIVIFFETYLQPGNGVVYTAYFQVAPGAADQVINIDSTFYPPGGNFALTLSNGFNIVPQYVPGTVTIGEPSNPEIAYDPASFSFTGTEGEADPPSQTLNISNSGSGTLEWSLTNASGWLGLSPTSGAGDDAVDVAVSLAGLTAGIYEDTIVISANAANSPQKVPVILTVDAPPPAIQLDPVNIEVTTTEGVNPSAEQITVTNIGGGELNWTASNLTGWISLDPTGGVGDGIITLNFDLTGVAAGVYYDTVTVTDPAAGNSPQKTSVMLTVEPPPASIQLDPTNIEVIAVEGVNPPAEQITVTNIGGGELNWTASNLTGWISLDPTGGVGDGTITLNFDLTGVTEGVYYDTVTVTDPAADNSPQKTSIMLTVEAAAPSIMLDPTEISLTATESGILPSEQINVSNTGGGELNWTASNLTGWISLNPTGGVGDGTITLDFDITGVPAGVYYDTITVSDPAADNSPQKTSVMLTIEELPDPEIGISPTEIFFNVGGGGGNPPDQMLTITNLGGGELNWTVEETEDWLSLDPLSGVGDGMVTVSVNSTGMANGVYPAVITITDPAAANSPVTVDVTLNISDMIYGMAVISPADQHFIRAYALPPKTDTVYIGNFDVTASEIDPATVLVNGFIPALSSSIIPSHPDFNGEVMMIEIEARPFIRDYPYPLEPTVHPFTVSGGFFNLLTFEAAGEVTLYSYTLGDANGDGIVDIGDPVFIIDYIFREGARPDPFGMGDANGDGTVDIGDVKYLINYIFNDGPAPVSR